MLPPLEVQLSTHLWEISKLQVFVPKAFYVGRISCGIAAFRKTAGCLQNAVIAFNLAVSTFQRSAFCAVQRRRLFGLVTLVVPSRIPAALAGVRGTSERIVR